jgi:hypothetical protein
MLRIYRASAAAQAQRDLAAIANEERKADREARAEERALKRQMATAAQFKSEPIKSDVVAPAAKVTIKPIGKTSEPAEGTARSRIKTYLAENPEATAGQVARDLGTDPSYTRKIVRDLKESTTSKSTTTETPEAILAEPVTLDGLNLQVVNVTEEGRLN